MVDHESLIECLDIILVCGSNALWRCRGFQTHLQRRWHRVLPISALFLVTFWEDLIRGVAHRRHLPGPGFGRMFDTIICYLFGLGLRFRRSQTYSEGCDLANRLAGAGGLPLLFS